MGSRLSTVATFLAGMAVGGGMVYLAPPAEPPAMGGPQGGGGMQGGPPGEGPDGGPPGGGMQGGPPGGPGMQGGPGGAAPPDGAQGAGLPGQDVVAPPGGGNPAQPAGGAEPQGSADAAQLPPPPAGAGPADGAAGPPLAAGAPAGKPGALMPPKDGQRATDWLEVHLGRAAEFWAAQAKTARGSSEPQIAALADAMDALAKQVPQAGELPPPLPDVVVMLYRELAMYDQMQAAGADVAAVEAELREVLAVR